MPVRSTQVVNLGNTSDYVILELQEEGRDKPLRTLNEHRLVLEIADRENLVRTVYVTTPMFSKDVGSNATWDLLIQLLTLGNSTCKTVLVRHYQ